MFTISRKLKICTGVQVWGTESILGTDTLGLLMCPVATDRLKGPQPIMGCGTGALPSPNSFGCRPREVPQQDPRLSHQEPIAEGLT